MGEQEFLELINTHQATINHLLRLYVHDADDKDDLKQEIILQAWKSKDKFLNQSSFNTWLYKLTLYTILTSKRKKGKMEHVDLREAEQIHYADHSEQEQAELLYQCISSLDDLSKSIITMHLDGFSNPEIADFMGITVNHLNVKLHRIKEKITNPLKAGTHGTR